VQRAEVATLRERLLGAACRREGVVRGDVQVGVDRWIDARDALEVGVDCLTWRDLPGADAVREGRRRLVAEVVSIHGSFLGLQTPALTGSLPKRNLDPAERARGAPHRPPGSCSSPRSDTVARVSTTHREAYRAGEQRGRRVAAPFLETTPKCWDALRRANLGHVLHFTHAVGRRMVERARGGSIINVVSIEGTGKPPLKSQGVKVPRLRGTCRR